MKKTIAHGLVTLYLLQNSELNQDTFTQTFSKENIIDTKIQFTLSNGSVHMMDLADVMKIDWNEVYNEDEEEATDNNISDS